MEAPQENKGQSAAAMQDPKHGRLLSALLRYRDPSQAPELAPHAADAVSAGCGEDSGSQMTVAMERATSSGSASGLPKVDDPARRSWLDRLSGVYNVAERHIARGAKALQKLAVPAGRFHDYQEAKDRLEQSAARLRGSDRTVALRHWVPAIAAPEQSPSPHPVIVAQPASPSGGAREEEEDWQQLSTLPVQGVSSGEKSGGGRASPSVLFVDHSGEGLEPVTFRELFLHSNALESIIAGYVQEPPTSQEEEELLSQLLGACFGGGGGDTHDELLADVLALGGAQTQCEQESVPGAQMQAIRDTVAQAVRGLKQKASVEILDRKMAILREEVAEQAAIAALLHKFNSGASEPTGEVTHQRLMQGLAATKEVMQLIEALSKIAGARTSLVVEEPPPAHPALLDALDRRTAHLSSAITAADAKLDENQSQQQESEAFKERKLSEMDASEAEVLEEIQGLQGQRAKLLAQLETVELALTKARARRADLEEGRNVFEEGNNFTIEALRHQAGELCGLQSQFEAESAAVAKCRQLVSRAQRSQRQMREIPIAHSRSGDGSRNLLNQRSNYLQEELGAARKSVMSVAREYRHAATRHLYFQRAQLQLVLRQLHYCAAELNGIVAKQQHVSSLGMERLLPDVDLQQRGLMQQYLDAELTQQAHLDQVAAVREKVQAVAQEAAAAAATVDAPIAGDEEATISSSPELEDLFESIDRLAKELQALERPKSLPPPGEKLPEVQDPLRRPSVHLESPVASRNPSATSSQGGKALPSGRLQSEPAVEGSGNSETSTAAVRGSPERPLAATGVGDLGLEDLLQHSDSDAAAKAADVGLSSELEKASAVEQGVEEDVRSLHESEQQ